MNFTHEIKDNVLVLTLSGDLIGEETGQDIIDVASSVIEKEINLCIINISDIRYINSSGIGILITVLTKFRNKGGEVCLVKPSENVEKLLIITKLNAIFNVAQTEEEAVQTLLKV